MSSGGAGPGDDIIDLSQSNSDAIKRARDVTPTVAAPVDVIDDDFADFLAAPVQETTLVLPLSGTAPKQSSINIPSADSAPAVVTASPGALSLSYGPPCSTCCNSSAASSASTSADI
ncbi:hypothetical protein GGX14DRAFT_557578 [Mycena pura]|uniref:Uncharacterized protein n=1 Tax=Mycena pura TaxID=153505 RepID=A0AAD7E0N1_9AGAR|nr:hypothetical protein GGX14DRAFT_557578 [Mycena pura]